MDKKLNQLFNSQRNYNFDLIVDSISSLIRTENKINPLFLSKVISESINGIAPDKILADLNKKSSSGIQFLSDLLSLIESFTHILKFVKEYLLKFFPKLNNLTINENYLRVKYGVKSDLINWVELVKIENPRIIRSLIAAGFQLPINFAGSLPNR